MYRREGIYCTVRYVQERRNTLYSRNILCSRICTEKKEYIVQLDMYRREGIYCAVGYAQKRRNILHSRNILYSRICTEKKEYIAQQEYFVQ